MNPLVHHAASLLKNCSCKYAVCGGYAIELFLNSKVRSHGDIDVTVFWDDRDAIITYMQSLGWQIYEPCGSGKAHHIADINKQLKIKSNVFCFQDGCELAKLVPTQENDIFTVDFIGNEQQTLNFIEFLFDSKSEDKFQYRRNSEITRDLAKAILINNGIPYLAPEIVLLYKSTDITRECNQLDFVSATGEMSKEQLLWLSKALHKQYPKGHQWAKAIDRLTEKHL